MSPNEVRAEGWPSPPGGRFFVLTGKTQSGKTTFLSERVAAARGLGVRVQGYLSRVVRDQDAVAGYDLLNLEDGKSAPFLRKERRPGWQTVGPYGLVPETLDIALGIIRRAEGAHPLVVDEIGPLELEGRGVWPALASALGARSEATLLVIREGLIDAFRPKIPALERALIFGVGDRAAADEALGG